MVKGFKDKDNVFHPIGQYRGGKKRATSHRYANDIGLSTLVERSISDFAIKRKNQFKEFKRNQQIEFEKEIEMRRRFSGKLIIAFRLARDQGITNPRQLEKFIRSQIPELPTGRKTNKFVEKVLREFVKQEKEFTKKISGKSEAEQRLLKQAFDNSIKESETRFANIQKDIDKKFKEQGEREQKEFDEKLKRIKKEEKEKLDAEKNAKKAEDELKKKVQINAPEFEIEEAEKKVEKTEKVAEKETKDETTFASEVITELEKEKKEMSESDFDFGFPTEIV